MLTLSKPMNSPTMTDEALDEFWRRATSIIKSRIIQPTMWRALEQMTPLIVEEDMLVLAVSTGMTYQASQLTSSDRRNAVENVLSELLGRRMSFRIIEGDSLEDWEHVKQRETLSRASQDRQKVTQDRERVLEHSWESVSEEVYRIYSRIPLKQLPQQRAAFLLQVLPVLAEGRARLFQGDNAKMEANQRGLARVIDRVATLADVPATWVALEVLRLAPPEPQET
jgi:hypothetical protein